MVAASSAHVDKTNGHMSRVSRGNPEGKRPLVRPRRRREDNVKMSVRGIG
jgi:hypothetical protein